MPILNKIMSEDHIETIINGVRVINFPKEEGALSRQTVKSIIYTMPELIRSSVIIDYDRIGPDIFKPIKVWHHEIIENGEKCSEETYPIVCTECFGQLKGFIASETHNYDSGNGDRILTLHDVPQRQCQTCEKVLKADSLVDEIEDLLDDFFLFHLNGRIEIPEEVDLITLRKFKGATKKAKEFRQKSSEAEKQGISLSAIDFLTS